MATLRESWDERRLVSDLPADFAAWQVADAKLRQIVGVALIDLLQRKVRVFEFELAGRHIFRVICRGSSHRTSLSNAHPELSRGRLVIRVAEAMPDARALYRVPDEGNPRILGSLHGNDHSRPCRQDRDKLFSVGFEPVEPAGVVVKKCKENNRANCEPGEMPFSWLQVSKKTEAENGRYRCESGPEEPDPSVVQRRTQVLGEKHG